MKSGLLSQIAGFTWQDIVLSIIDIAIVSYLFYKVFILIRGTRAVQLLKGVAVLFILVFVTQILRLYTMNYLLVTVRNMLVVALPILFWPEFRRALEQLGRSGLFSRSFFELEKTSSLEVVDEVLEAVFNLSSSKTGSLIVIERETALGDYMEGSPRLDALVSKELLQNIFVRNTPLHDGATIIRGDRIVAAACFLPPTQEVVTVELGSRHRAALGVTQVSDAIAIIVSEETGTVSLAVGGRLWRGLDRATLKEKIQELMPQEPRVTQMLHWGSSK